MCNSMMHQLIIKYHPQLLVQTYTHKTKLRGGLRTTLSIKIYCHCKSTT